MTLTVLVAVTIAPISGFLFNFHCPAPSPCRCGHNFILCAGENLRDVPVFTSTTPTRVIFWFLNLSRNRISSLPSNAFQNLVAFNNGHKVNIDLSYNLLTDVGVSVDAFNGIANYVYHLYVGSNRLTSIPAAIGKLTHLETLNITDNPLVTVDDNVIIPIGSTLLSFYVSLQHTAPNWPDAFQYLTRIVRLYVWHAKQSLTADAFSGFASSILELHLHNATFGFIPTAACHADHLLELYIEDDPNFTGDSNVNCNSSSIHYVTLTNDGIDVFPTVLQSFPGLETIHLLRTNIRSIRESLVPDNSNITEITISDSKLTSFPKALERFSALRRCDLSRNLITTLGPNSVKNFPHLWELILNGNPIRSISQNAFRNLPTINTLRLSDTKLTTIPQAVTSLPKVSLLVLYHNEIACDCSQQWINHWSSAQTLDIAGTCGGASGETIRHYIHGALPTCT